MSQMSQVQDCHKIVIRSFVNLGPVLSLSV